MGFILLDAVGWPVYTVVVMAMVIGLVAYVWDQRHADEREV